MVKSELYQANEQALRSNTDNFSKVNLMGVVLGIGTTIAGFVNNINWLAGFGFASTTFTSLPVLKEAYVSLARRQKWNWFVRFKSFAEKQAGFDKPVENPWPLSDL